MIKRLIRIIKNIKDVFLEMIVNHFDEDYEDVKYFTKRYSFIQLENMIFDKKMVNLCKKAWKRKSGLEFPYVYNQDYEICKVVSNKAEKLREAL